MTIYVVKGECGAYEDHMEWDSKSFTNEDLASQTMSEYQAYANTQVPGNTYDDAFINNSPDQWFRTDSTGTGYWVEELELVTDKFMEESLSITNKD